MRDTEVTMMPQPPTPEQTPCQFRQRIQGTGKGGRKTGETATTHSFPRKDKPFASKARPASPTLADELSWVDPSLYGPLLRIAEAQGLGVRETKVPGRAPRRTKMQVGGMYVPKVRAIMVNEEQPTEVKTFAVAHALAHSRFYPWAGIEAKAYAKAYAMAYSLAQSPIYPRSKPLESVHGDHYEAIEVKADRFARKLLALVASKLAGQEATAR